jgi:hypothetical protein
MFKRDPLYPPPADVSDAILSDRMRLAKEHAEKVNKSKNNQPRWRTREEMSQ